MWYKECSVIFIIYFYLFNYITPLLVLCIDLSYNGTIFCNNEKENNIWVTCKSWFLALTTRQSHTVYNSIANYNRSDDLLELFEEKMLSSSVK